MGDFNTKYNLIEVYSDSKQSEFNTKSQPAVAEDQTANPNSLILDNDNFANLTQTVESNFDSLCSLYIANKQFYAMIRNKPMTEANKKLKEVHVNL